MGLVSADHVLEEVAAADDQRLLALLERALERAVLDLDGDVAVVAGVGEGAEEGAPADVAQAGELGRVPELGVREDAVRVERGAVDPGVLGVDVDQPVAELGQRARGSPSAARPGATGRSSGRSSGSGSRRTSAARSPGWSPGSCRRATRPAVNSIGQFSIPIRTPAVLGVPDQRPPDLEEPRPVRVDRQRRVAADERVDHADPQVGRGVDQPCAGGRRRSPTRRGRPRAGSGNSRGPRSPRRSRPSGRGPASGRRPSRSVTSRWVTPAYRRSARPGGQHISSTLENPASAANPSTCSSVNSGKIAETNPSFIAVPPLGVARDRAQSVVSTSTQACSRALRAIASQSRTSRWPSSNVGKVGGSSGSPFAAAPIQR